MSPVRSIRNQYRGVNANLHSRWLAEGGWNNFHNVHISNLVRMLRPLLLPMGYTATIEDSLQIRRLADDLPQTPRADMLISREFSTQPYSFSSPPAMAAELTIEDLLLDLVETEKPYRAVAIAPREGSNATPIAWIELLSPSNKGKHRDAMIYQDKRDSLLDAGMVFVEVDYLHDTPSTFAALADYTLRNDRDAFPYRIVVLKPHPDSRRGVALPIEFRVDVPIPSIAVPLKNDESITIDFGAAYRKTYEEIVYGLEYVDYAELPQHFDRYRPGDQLRIVRRMISMLRAAARGDALEQGVVDGEEMTLEAGLAELEALRSKNQTKH
jgi:hypothetical protein